MRFAFKILTAAFAVLIASHSKAQMLHGTVAAAGADGKTELLPGVNVYWLNKNIIATTDEKGHFAIAYPDSFPASLIASFIGYKTDTTVFAEKISKQFSIKLRSSIDLQTVEIKGKRESTIISTISPINSQTITQKELVKAACCNLSESFEKNASVDVAFTDAVTGAKQIQMLGLDGIYTQIQSENMPLIYGLSSAHGLTYTPGPWIESIYVSKGAGSVVNGYQSITGQINVELVEPDKADKLFVNGYGSNEGRIEGNIIASKKFKEGIKSALFLHSNAHLKKADHNHDSFLDVPVGKQFNAVNRWDFRGTGRMEGQLFLKALYDDRIGGQKNFEESMKGTMQAYGVGINSKLFEIGTKTGYVSAGKPWQSLGFITQTRYHALDNHYGLKTYEGGQKNFYANLIFESIIGTTFHKYRTGLSFNAERMDEQFNDSTFGRVYTIPGAFFEYTLDKPEKFSMVAGMRADYHNEFGTFFTPRLHFKYHAGKATTLRLSGGSGWRTANIFAENTGIFVSSRQLVILNTLKPEEAWNYGATLIHRFKFIADEATFSADYFRTDFTNQVVIDIENAHYIRVYNLRTNSYSNSWQAEFSFSPIEKMDLLIAYKKYDVKTKYGYSGWLNKPLLAEDRILATASYATPFEKWQIDFTLKWFGKSRIPELVHPAGEELSKDNLSDDYVLLNGQITKKFRHFSVYAGCENITDYTQEHPVMGHENPFGENFDASVVYAPLMGRTFYGGFRFSLKGKG